MLGGFHAMIFSHPDVLGYHSQGHPESPERVSKTRQRLEAAGHKIAVPRYQAVEADALLAHDKTHVDAVKNGEYLDADTPYYPGIAAIAFTSLSGAVDAAFAAMAEDPSFSLMRPPGHHAGRNHVAGFCYFNNVAVACEKLLQDKKVSRVAILDVDVHHGDGTEDIFSGRSGVLYASLHQVPLYPGTGLVSHDNCLNFPLPEGTEEGFYLEALEKAIEHILDFKPGILAVSAGFDTYKECPIAGLRLEKKSYRRIGAMIAQTRLKRFAVLEGGYAADLPILVDNFLDGFFA
ncbi:MAG TPA: histone deacetylase [Elusimicrobiota bacterium]|nr:histone deacetylase [Elusimicrobiota bacterium]